MEEFVAFVWGKLLGQTASDFVSLRTKSDVRFGPKVVLSDEMIGYTLNRGDRQRRIPSLLFCLS